MMHNRKVRIINTLQRGSLNRYYLLFCINYIDGFSFHKQQKNKNICIILSFNIYLVNLFLKDFIYNFYLGKDMILFSSE